MYWLAIDHALDNHPLAVMMPAAQSLSHLIHHMCSHLEQTREISEASQVGLSFL